MPAIEMKQRTFADHPRRLVAKNLGNMISMEECHNNCLDEPLVFLR